MPAAGEIVVIVNFGSALTAAAGLRAFSAPGAKPAMVEPSKAPLSYRDRFIAFEDNGV